MKVHLKWTLGALLITVSLSGSAAALPLSNTPVAQGNICAVYDCVSPVAALIDTFFFTPAPDPDGQLLSLVLAGSDASTAGLFLYGYHLTNFDTGTEVIHGLSVPFAGIVPPIPPNAASFSFICVDCSSFTDKPPTPAQYDPVLDTAQWFFLDPGSLAAGDASLLFGAVSTFAPFVSDVAVLGTIQGAQADALIPTPAAVPEPAAILLIGSAVAGIATRRRRPQR
jgi:hypothetical protein